MTRVRLFDPVRLPDGRIGTLAQFADADLIEFRKITNFGDRGITKYLAELKDGSGAWEIGELAYLSRTGARNEIQARLS